MFSFTIDPFQGYANVRTERSNNEKKRCLCSYWGFELLFLCASKGLFLHGNEKGPQGICFMKWLIYWSSSVNDGVFLDKKTGSEEALEVIFQETGPVAYTSVLYLCGQSDTVVFFPGELHQVTFLCRNSNMLWTIIDNANCSQKSIPLDMPLYVRRTKLRIRNSTFAIRDLIFRGGGGFWGSHGFQGERSGISRRQQSIKEWH